MKAAYFLQHGNISQIKYGDLPIPEVNPSEILIQTKFASVNHLDLFVLQGWPGLHLKLPHIMGSDGSGIVKEVGTNVSNFRKGDKVVINPGIGCNQCEFCVAGQQSLCKYFSIKGEHQDGTFAEYFTIPTQNALKIPDYFGLKEAAAGALTFLTAWRMLVSKAKIKQNDFVLIQGASGGVSIAAIQIAKFFGAKVITTTSSHEKVEKAKKLGADYVINYNEIPNYTKKIYKEITKEHGIDIVIDSVGKATFSKSIKLLSKGGKLITCGATTGPTTAIDIRNLFWKQISLIGSTMSNHHEFLKVMQLIFERKLIPLIDSIYSLDNVKEAEHFLKIGNHFGKIVIEI
ncbi:zinc-binding dehydrogenase [Candidatus Harpocratesius sp.]